MATQLKKVVAPSGGDYTSLEACMNANEQNLVTADKYFDVEISGSWSTADTTAVTVHNYTTDATRYINIYTTGDARHAGVYSTSKYILSNASNHLILNYVLNITIDGLQFYNTAGGFWCFASIQSGALGLVIKNNIAVKTARYGGAFVIDTSTSGSATIFNNIVYSRNNQDNFGFDFRNTSISVYAYNNTVYGFTKGLSTQGTTVYSKNNISYNNAYDYEGTFQATSTNNLSKDATAPALNTYYRNKTLAFTNTTSGSEDFHLVSGDTDAIDKGADLSGTFTTDIDGATRSGTWDIGADEYVAAGATAVPLRMLMGIGT
jgi:hypothetical protein